MRTLLVAAKIQKFVAVAHNAFPLLLKQGFELYQVLQNDTDRHTSGTHNREYLVEVIGQRNIGKLVHNEMAMHGQASAVLVVGKIKKLLEKLRV